MSRFARRASVALISAGTLAFEILLVRTFAIEQFYHFAYMAIGVAMLGFGVSGTALALAGRAARDPRLFGWAAAATPVCLLAAPVVVDGIALDPTQLAWDARQWWGLGAAYVVLALPFFTGALAVLAGLGAEPETPGSLYGASFLGAGAGAAGAVAALWSVAPDRALAVPALLAAGGAVACWRGAGRGLRAVTTTAAGAALVSFAAPPWRLHVSDFKGLPQAEALPGARRVAEAHSPVGWVVAVQAPALRDLPGLALLYPGGFPEQTGLFVDGQRVGAATRWDEATGELLTWLTTAAPYAVRRPRSVLVLGAGAPEGAAARRAGADVTVVEVHPALVRLVDSLGAVPGSWSADGRRVTGDFRGFLSRSPRRYDLIALGQAGALGAAAGGVHALGEDFLHTVDAYEAYLGRLDTSGILAVTRWLAIPPRGSVRTVLSLAEALRRTGHEGVGDLMVVVRSWATVTVLVKPAGFGPDELARLTRWAESRAFDVDWYPGIRSPPPSRNALGEPVFYRAMQAARTTGGAAAFAADHPFAVAPVGDARPYPHRFLRLGALPAMLGGERGEWLPFVEWGYLALIATLLQSAVVAAVLLVAPAVWWARRTRGSLGRVLPYFGGIGVAYIAAEIAAIQQLALLLGHPVYAVAGALTAFLVCSGLGATWSDRRPVPGPGPLGALLAGVLMLYGAALLPTVHLLQGTPLPVRAGAALALLGPLAFVMGIPFPLGIRRLVGRDSGALAWGWAANGFMSVVGAPLAALLAVERGSPTVFVVAGAAYGVAAVAARAQRGPGG